VKSYGGFWIGVAGAALTRFKRLDTSPSEDHDFALNTHIERRIKLCHSLWGLVFLVYVVSAACSTFAAPCVRTVLPRRVITAKMPYHERTNLNLHYPDDLVI